MPSVSVRSCSAFVREISSKNLLFRRKSSKNNVGVATRRAQIVWPMMTVTVTNFEGFTRHFRSFSSEIHIFANFQNCYLMKPSKFVTVTVIIGHTI